MLTGNNHFNLFFLTRAFIEHNCKYYEEFTEFCHLEDDHVTSKSKPREDVVGHAKKDAKCESHSAGTVKIPELNTSGCGISDLKFCLYC